MTIKHEQYRFLNGSLYEYQPDPVGGAGAYIHVGRYPRAKNKAQAVRMHEQAEAMEHMEPRW